MLARVPGLTEEQRRELSAFSERLVNKLLHPQIQGIKEEAAKGDGDSIRRIAQALGIDKVVAPADHPAPEEHAAGQHPTQHPKTKT
jgi:hypothetical protein